MAIQGFYNGTANIRRQAATKDASRGPLTDAPILYAAVACRIEDSGGAQVFMVNQLAMIATHRVYMDSPGGAIVNGDIIEELSPTAVTNYYRVINPQTRRGIGSIPSYLAIDVTEFAP